MNFRFNLGHLFGLALWTAAWIPASAATLEIVSPSGTVKAGIWADGSGRLTYSIQRNGEVIIEPSPLGITVDGVDLGDGVRLGKPRLSRLDETYPVFGGHTLATNRYCTAEIPVIHGQSRTHYVLEVRAFDDGVGWRYRVPGKGSRCVAGEASSWTLPAGSQVWFGERNNSWKLKSYAGEWTRTAVDNLPTISQQGPVQTAPLVAELPGGGYAALTEAAVFNYSGLRFRAVGVRRVTVDFTESTNGFVLSGEIVTPWRVVLVAPDLNALVNSDLLSNLCPPPDPKLFADTGWIKPGRAAWRWWSLGTGTPEQEQHIVDDAAALGFEYSLVDEGWGLWTNSWESVSNLCAYARAKHVGVFFWKRYDDVSSPGSNWQSLREFLTRMKQVGAAGVKIDFLNAESLDRIRFEEAAMRMAAENRLLIDIHGCQKPGGESRTYPNELSREAVRGLELNKMKEGPIIPRHNAALPFTRFVVGPADYTPVGFSNPGATTFAHQLATIILFTSPIMTVAENPDMLLNDPTVRPALDILKRAPAIWDETRVLKPSAIGELALMARRKGQTWFLAGVNGGDTPVKLAALDLSFLGSGRYHAVLLTSPAPRSFARREIAGVTAATELPVEFAAGDGVVCCFEPAD